MPEKKIKVLMCKAGLDGHDRGVKAVSHFLRDAGMEVVYSGLFQWPKGIVNAAIQEYVDVIGLSILSGEHLTYPRQVVDLLKEEGVRDNMLVVVGGIIPRQHIPLLEEAGVDKVFDNRTPMSEIIEYIKETVSKKRLES